jgi:hypothetical protein
MKLDKPQIIQKDGQAVYQVAVDSLKGPESLWYALPKSFASLLSDSSDASVVALLIPAMADGEDIHINGSISEKLYYNLSGLYQKILQMIIPSLHQIKIHPKAIRSTQSSRALGVATGFSAGIDSYSVLVDHYFEEKLEGFKVSHLLYNNVGSHGSGGTQLFEKRARRLQPLAERMGLPFLMVNSNLNSFYGRGLNFQLTHTPRNASVALLLQNGVGRFLYASAYSYSDVFVGPTYDMAYSDPITLPLLSTENLDAFSVGSNSSRVEKTLRVANVPESYSSLDICVIADHVGEKVNCSECWKCLRTMATLEISGLQERYSAVFDLGKYKSQRIMYFAILLDSSDPLLREIVKFAKDRKYKFPILSYLVHYLHIYPINRLFKTIFYYLADMVKKNYYKFLKGIISKL